MSYYDDDRYDPYEYYRQRDDFYRDQDRQYENFQDDLKWQQQQYKQRSELAKDAVKQGDIPWALHWMDGTDHAIDLLRQQTLTVSTTHPKPDPDELMGSAVQSFRARLFEKAVKQFSHVIQLWPDFGSAYAYRATCRYALREYGEAVSDLNTALRILPGRSALYLERGRAYERMGETDKAETDYNHAIEIDSDSFSAYDKRGLLRMRSRRFKDAITDFSRAIRAKPPYLSYVYLDRGRCRFYTDQFSSAITDFSAVLNIEPGNIDAYMGRARCYRAKKQWLKAIEDCDRAIQLKPDGADALRIRGGAGPLLTIFKVHLEILINRLKWIPLVA